MAEMEHTESFERFSEGLKKAASRARELGSAQKNRDWNKIAFNLETLIERGKTIYARRALSRDQVLAMLDSKVKKTDEKLNG